MSKELTMFNQPKEVRINSVELVEIVNQFRKLENETTGKKYTELLHKSFMTKIKNELEVLESLGLIDGQNILLVEYTDKKGEKRPCYSLNRDGMLQMLNSESALVRFKTIEYINNLEEQTQGKANLLLSIYNGGQEGILAAKQLTEIEIKEATTPLLAKIEEDKPLVEFSNTVLKSSDNILIRELAKLAHEQGIDIGQNKLYDKLREWKYIMKDSTEPYQSAMNQGLFVVEEKPYKTPYGTRLSKTTKVTPKGQVYLIEKLRKSTNK